MIDTICIYEDKDSVKLLPLVYLRPVYDLRCGIFTLREKVQRCFPKAKISLSCRSYLEGSLRQNNPNHHVNELNTESCLFINGRVILNQKAANELSVKNDTIFFNGETIVAAKLSGKNLTRMLHRLNDPISFDEFASLPRKQINVKMITYPWDLITHNGEQLAVDYKELTFRSKKKIKGKVFNGAYLLNKKNIFIGEGSKVKPGVVLDAESGPIYIGKNVTIFPNSVIEGPAYIGDNSIVKIGAKIYSNTSVGPVCKIGGEIENSILHSYSNKQHDGFLGHAYLGSWVNIGADTNNSDLNNNYNTVKVVINGEMVDSKLTFVGLFMSDHSKCSINTMFNTGTVVGVSSIVFGVGFPHKSIPSFAYGGADNSSINEIEKAIDVAKRVTARRNVNFTLEDEKLFRLVFELTKDERKN